MKAASTTSCGAGEMEAIVRGNSQSQQDERNCADHARRSDTERRQWESGDARQDRRGEEQRGPSAGRPSGQQAVQDDEA